MVETDKKRVGVWFAVALFVAAFVGVAQGAEAPRKLPKLVDQCKTSCATSAKGDAKKQTSCEHMCGVVFDGAKKTAEVAVAMDTNDSVDAPPSAEDLWRVRQACQNSCQTTLWSCEDGCTDRHLPADSLCNGVCSAQHYECEDMCDVMFPFATAPPVTNDE